MVNSLKKNHVLFAIILFIITILADTFLNIEYLNLLFLISFIIHFTIISYLIYSIYEMNFLHERQGSKLKLANQKSKFLIGAKCD